MNRSLVVLCVAVVSLPAFAQPKKPTPRESRSMESSKPFRLSNPDSLFKPTAGYSQIAEVTGGKVVFIAGQVAVDRAGNLVGKGDLRAQLQQVFENLKAAVQASGGTFADVIKLNFYCVDKVDASQLPAVREVRDRFVDTAHPPTSAFVFVSRLVHPEWLIEVEAVAVIKK